MVNVNMDRNLEAVRQKDKDRRTSVLPAGTTNDHNVDAPDAWSIANTTQLGQWVKRYPDDVMSMIQDIRFDRDQFLSVAVLYEHMKDAKAVVDEKLAETRNSLAASETKVEEYKKLLRAPEGGDKKVDTDDDTKINTDSAPLV